MAKDVNIGGTGNGDLLVTILYEYREFETGI